VCDLGFDIIQRELFFPGVVGRKEVNLLCVMSRLKCNSLHALLDY
jgi:hypothetical protein